MTTGTDRRIRVGIVGPCTSGKSTLMHNLHLEDFELRHIAQEHSFVPAMWQLLTKPDVLIFLDVSFAESLRRKKLNWNEDEYLEQQRRLQHARAHAALIIMTDDLTAEQVASQVQTFLLGVQSA